MRTRLGWGGLATSLLLGITTSALGTSGCSSSSSAAPAPTGIFTVQNYPKPAIANAVSPGDPLWEGQYYLLYDTWGSELNGGWPVDFLLQVLKAEPEFFGNQFENFGLIPDPNDDLPIGYKRGTADPTVAFTTCAPCHTGKLPDGSIWFGQPNLQIDLPRLDSELNKRWMAAGHPSMIDAVSLARATAYGPGRFRLESDAYPHAVAANIPVHYDLAERSHTTTVGGALDARSDIFLSVGSNVGFPLDNNTKTPFPSDDVMNALVGFMTSHHPPTAPAQDANAIAAGKAVFHTAQCDSCHHPDNISLDGVVTLDSSATGIDRLPGVDPNFPRGSIHVDPYQYYMAFGDPNQPGSASGALDPQTVTIIKFGYIHKLNVGTTDGYEAPNLHGLWASAPYLNNGSVPTLQDLLNPASQRPATFVVQGFTFDTTQIGNSNMGHEFGTTLSASDKTSLIAYLNSL
jgi:cytochrome c553